MSNCIRRISMLLPIIWLIVSISQGWATGPETQLVAISLREAQRVFLQGEEVEREALRGSSGITQLIGYLFDTKNKDVILIGKHNAKGSLLTFDDLVVLLRAAQTSGRQGPSVSLEPKDGAEVGQMEVVFHGGLEDSGPGKTIFAADYLMKSIALGDVPLSVKGVKPYAQLSLDKFREQGQDEWNVLSRFWFVPIYAPPWENPEGQDTCLLLRGTQVGVLVETLNAEINGKATPEFKDAPAWTYADKFSLHYSEIAADYPTFIDLANTMGALKLMMLLISRPAPINLDYWTKQYQSVPVEIPKQVPLLKKTFSDERRQLTVVGGVRIAGLTLRLRRGEPTAIRDLILTARPAASSVTWTVSFDKDWQINLPDIEPSDREIARLFTDGLLALEQGKDAEALRCFDSILAQYPEVTEARFFKAIAKRNLVIKSGQPQDAVAAVAEFRKIADDEPNLTEARYELAVTLDALGQHDQAVLELNKVIEQRPDYAPAYFACGMTYYHKGDYTNARISLLRYLEIATSSISDFRQRAKEVLAIIEKQKGEPDAAPLFVPFSDQDAGLSIEYPKEWRVLRGDTLSRTLLPGMEAAKAVIVAFVHPHDADLNVNVRLTPIGAEELTDQDIVGAIPQLDAAYGKQFSAFQKVEAGAVTVGGVKGLRYVFKSERAGTQLEQCVVTLVKARKAYTITFTAKQTAYDEAYKAHYEHMFNSIRIGHADH